MIFTVFTAAHLDAEIYIRESTFPHFLFFFFFEDIWLCFEANVLFWTMEAKETLDWTDWSWNTNRRFSIKKLIQNKDYVFRALRVWCCYVSNVIKGNKSLMQTGTEDNELPCDAMFPFIFWKCHIVWHQVSSLDSFSIPQRPLSNAVHTNTIIKTNNIHRVQKAMNMLETENKQRLRMKVIQKENVWGETERLWTKFSDKFPSDHQWGCFSFISYIFIKAKITIDKCEGVSWCDEPTSPESAAPCSFTELYNKF